mmetsp:Transcript_7723/g.10949  ORF Transcript_7723/g.10949 Transcript_7723/m.10949 type:complete len:154 (-) Transcript_7723:123-584(-)
MNPSHHKRQLPGPAGERYLYQDTGDHVKVADTQMSSVTEYQMPKSWLILNQLLNKREEIPVEVSNIRQILDGECDFRVSLLAAIVQDFVRYVDGSWILSLKDTSGVINAFISEQDSSHLRNILCKDVSVLLENVRELSCIFLGLHLFVSFLPL